MCVCVGGIVTCVWGGYSDVCVCVGGGVEKLTSLQVMTGGGLPVLTQPSSTREPLTTLYDIDTVSTEVGEAAGELS